MTTLAILAAVYMALLTLPTLLMMPKGEPGERAARGVVAMFNAGVVALLIAFAVML